MDVKRSLSRCFRDHNLHPRVTFLCTLLALSFLPPDKCFYIFFKLKSITCIQPVWNKTYRLPCSFKRKRAFISLSSLPCGRSLTLYMRSFARTIDAKIVRSRCAIRPRTLALHKPRLMLSAACVRRELVKMYRLYGTFASYGSRGLCNPRL